MESVVPSQRLANDVASTAADNELQFVLSATAFGFRLHEHLDPKTVSYIAVNDAAVLTGCDRFSLAIAKGRSARLFAVTGQERVSRRSGTVRRLESLATAALAFNRAVVYTGQLEEVDPLIQPKLADYIEESHVRMLAILPLRRLTNKQRRQGLKARIENQSSGQQDKKVFALLVMESFGTSQPVATLPRRCRLLADHIESALAAAKQHQKIPFRRSITAVADFFADLRGRRLLSSITILALFVGLIAALLFTPATFRVACKGVLMPVSQQRYFTPMDAKVTGVLVQDGQPVQAGDVLIELTSEILQADLVAAKVSVSENRKLAEALSARMSILQVSGSERDSIELQAEMAKAEIDLAGAVETLEVLRSRQRELTIRATKSGIVNGFRLRETLLDRPVDRGNKLLEVVQPNGPWQLELEIDEFRAGPVVEASLKQKAPLKVKYVLATRVDEDRRASLRQLARQVDLGRQGDRYVLHAIADTTLRDAVPDYVGAEVFAKIEAGQRCLGYVLFGDVLDFLRRTIWF